MRVPHQTDRRSSFDSETMTPMIDVVFLLLVFFVCASIGQIPEDVLPAEFHAGTTTDVEVPEPEPQDVWDHQQLRIRVELNAAGQNTFLLNEQPVADLAELTGRLAGMAEIDPSSPVIVDVADNVPFQQFITVYDLCQSLQFEQVLLAADPNEENVQ
ncbi:MAG: biopolymer transporter ExbD [Planctomycetaceae bacterium]|nr:biopolymer transporter ExbD [Planctomycetaceae bacterium]